MLDDTISVYLDGLAGRTAAPAGGATAATSRTNMEANLSGITDLVARGRLTRVAADIVGLQGAGGSPSLLHSSNAWSPFAAS